AAVLLVAGPWTNEAEELVGWDVARFQALADESGRHWVDHPVEYPPGSVILIEAVASNGVVETHRTLAATSLAIDLGVAAVLGALTGRRAAATYLLIGLPLVPMGLVRFDLWSVAAAVLAVAALRQRRSGAFAALTAIGALIKVWPALLVAVSVSLGRRAATVAAIAALLLAGAGWLAYGGWSLDPIDQVLSLRGATGWHVESFGGNLTALTTDEGPERQLDAFRIGRLDDRIVTAGRALTVAAVGLLVVLGRRASRHGRPVGTKSAMTEAGGDDLDLEVVALVMLGSTAVLLVTAPLLSPQFLLWLTPWAALLPLHRSRPALPVMLTGGATTLTGGVLALYGPPRLAETVPALVLLVRNGLLAATVVAAIVAIADLGRPEDPLGHRSARPRPARAEAEVDEVTEEPGRLTG
ncbi:MAG: hypothetical protein OEV40_10365, partial [Acidimicrobiia bacterium]|nr:hypothetical protein [Acidimicrobiia bacterium]